VIPVEDVAGEVGEEDVHAPPGSGIVVAQIVREPAALLETKPSQDRAEHPPTYQSNLLANRSQQAQRVREGTLDSEVRADNNQGDGSDELVKGPKRVEVEPAIGHELLAELTNAKLAI